MMLAREANERLRRTAAEQYEAAKKSKQQAGFELVLALVGVVGGLTLLVVLVTSGPWP